MASDKGSKEALSRQKALESERQQLMTDIQREREKIVADSHIDISANRFVSAKLDVESSLKRDTIGLVQLNQFQKIREQLEQKEAEARKKQDERNTKRKQKSTIEKSKLSFDDEDAEEEVIVKRPKTKKDPTVNTRFLPDKEREEREALEREKLRLEWLELQEQVKQDPIEITFSYWDGHGHRSSVECLKGDSIDIFLSKARDKFPQIRGVGTDKLMFVKEDLIIPHVCPSDPFHHQLIVLGSTTRFMTSF